MENSSKWNRPIKGGNDKSKDGRSGLRGALAALLVVAGAGIAAFFIMSRDKEPPQQEVSPKPSKPIAEVKPAPSPESVQALPTNTEEVVAAAVQTNAAPAAKPNTPWANKPRRVIKHRASDQKPRRFEYDAEEHIAALLEIEPGTLMYGDLPYGKRFVEDFKNSLAVKVKIKPEDDEYTRNLKKQVQAVKDDLKEVLLAGGDVGEEMRKARNDLKELGAYKESLRRELFEMRKSGAHSSQEMKDYIDAANKLLESKGLSPLKMPRIFLRNLELKEGKKSK